MHMPCRNGKEGWGVYPVVSGALLLPLLLAVRVCIVFKGEGGQTEGFVSIIWRAWPVCWVSLRPCTALVPASSVILTLVEVWAPLSPVLAACHRFKRIQTDPLYLPEILISEYALSWPACTDKPLGLELNSAPPAYATAPPGRHLMTAYKLSFSSGFGHVIFSIWPCCIFLPNLVHIASSIP